MIDQLIMAWANAVLYAANPRLVRHYRRCIGRLPDIANPKRYTERMLWRKIVDHNPQFVVFSDKLATKEFCRKICPDLPVPKTLWTGVDADTIPDELLRGDVFVKTNHGYNFNYFIREGRVDRADLKAKTDRWLRFTHGIHEGQWAYSMIEPKLFVEESIGDASGDLLDFNIRASNGTVILGSVIGHNKKPDSWIVYLDRDGRPTAGVKDEDGKPPTLLPDGLEISKPYQLALRYAERLSAGVDYARFDFMWNGTQLYGGEITVYPAAGINEIANRAVNSAILTGWDMEISHFLRTRHKGFKRIYANALRRQVQKGSRTPAP